MTQDAGLDEAKEMPEKSHREVMRLMETFTDEDLFSKGVYNRAIKKLKAHRKNRRTI